MYYVCCIIFTLIFFPVSVFAVDDSNIRIFINGQDTDRMLFDYQLGSKSNATLQIDNVGDKKERYVVYITDSEGRKAKDAGVMSLVEKTRFFDSTLDEMTQNVLEQNNGDIANFCAKSENGDLSWCEGHAILEVDIAAKESVKIPFVVEIAQDEKDHEAIIIIAQAKDNNAVIKKIDIAYRVPDKNITKLDLSGFRMEKSIEYSGVNRLLHSGSKNSYQSFIKIANTGTEKVSYAYNVSVESLWIGEMMNFEGSGNILPGEIDDNKMIITLPRGGKVRVLSNIIYTDQNGHEVIVSSLPITMFVWPVQLITVILVGICFCMICALLYKYINKNMFNFRKKKKEENLFTGTYIVQDADNIISIAQKYDIAWKDLAANNKIDPPYILISGETIHVPKEEQASPHDMNNDTSDNAESSEEKEDSKVNVSQQEQSINSEQKIYASPIIKSQNIPLAQNPQRLVADMNTDVQQETPVKKQMQTPVNKKIIYASEESTLIQPSAEPTTRAIDIEWMRDDEAAYIEEMELQEKKLNIRIVSIAIITLCAVSAGIWFGTTKFIEYKKSKSVVSVEKLIKEESVVTEKISEQKQVSENNVEVVGDTKKDEDVNVTTGEIQKTQNNIEPKDITIQVLNAGAAVGAAGAVSDIFKEKNYNMKSPQNAKNDYSGVVIYYKENKENANTLLALIPEKYSDKKIEESVDITGTYKADYVIVLGK